MSRTIKSAHFVLKRFLEGYEEYGDLYEAIKSGRKTVEYRDATKHWKTRLLTIEGLDHLDYHQIYESGELELTGDQLKHNKATFVVGYTKHPKLVADITKIVYNQDTDQLITHIINVRENPCIGTGLQCTKEYDCDNCVVYLVNYYKWVESQNNSSEESFDEKG